MALGDLRVGTCGMLEEEQAEYCFTSWLGCCALLASPCSAPWLTSPPAAAPASLVSAAECRSRDSADSRLPDSCDTNAPTESADIVAHMGALKKWAHTITT